MKKIFEIIFIILIIFIPINCGLCGINPPEDKSYCGNYLSLNRTHRCAYCRNIDTGKYNCLLQIKNETIEGFECGNSDDILVNEDLPGSPCLNHKDIKNKDPDEINAKFCKAHSIDDKHPCCFFDDGVNKKCFSIGKITSVTLYTYNDFLQCSTQYFKINKIFYLLIIFIFYI